LEARPVLNSLLKEQDRIGKYKAEQISNLSRRGKSAKRLKGEPTAEAESESQLPPAESQALAIEEVPKEINVRLLSDAATRMGWVAYKSSRIRGGKLGYRRIKVSWDVRVCHCRS
jgi:hypothetical protein